MRPKYNSTKFNVQFGAADETLENNSYTDCLCGILHFLIENGAPLDPDSVKGSFDHYSYNNSSNPTNNYERFTFSAGANFIDTKYDIAPDGIEYSRKYFGLELQYYYYPNQNNKINCSFAYKASENNVMQYSQGDGNYWYPYEFWVTDNTSKYWNSSVPFLELKVNVIKSGDSLFFGIVNYSSRLAIGYEPSVINMAFTPVKSLTDPTKKFDYCVLRLDHNFFPTSEYDSRVYSYGSYIYASKPELEMRGSDNGFIGINSIGGFINADDTNKVVLLPLMIGYNDYYYDKVYISNVIKKGEKEEAVELDKGIFLIVDSPCLIVEESKNQIGMLLFDITEAMNQEENNV